MPISWSYKARGYKHFDPYPAQDHVEAYVRDPLKISSHSFWPLIRYDIVSSKYRHGSATTSRPSKTRPIAYAAHMDGAIFSYYAALLASSYEKELEQRDLSDVVLAYRKNTGAAYKNAICAFREIEALPHSTAYPFDVSSFFDTLNHSVLKKAWCQLLGVGELPHPHFQVFKAATKYSYVHQNDIRSAGLKTARGQRICTPAQFREHFRRKNKIERNLNGYGIPQGLPISAILSNFYMLDLDERLNAFAKARGGTYRRYADDLLLILPRAGCAPDQELDAEVAQEAQAALSDVNLSIQPEKSSGPVHFTNSDVVSKPLQYLGLTFDGRSIRIRQASVARFYRKMRRGVYGKAYCALNASIDPNRLWKRKLRLQYSHEGRRTFYAYAKRVAEESGSNLPLHQLRKHTFILNDLIEDAERIAKGI